jgi:signal transduction histidine kinase
MLTGKWLFLVLAVFPVLTDLLSTAASPSGFWSLFLPSLYYVSIVMGGLTLGWKAGLALACMAGLSHGLISHFLLAGPLVRLAAELLAFLVVGFAFFEERRQAADRRVEKAPQMAGLDPRTCVEQVSEIASELLREIRTPLASIEGAAFILSEDESDLANPAEFVEIIQRECHRVNAALAEINACTEPRPLTCETADLGSILSEVARLSALEVPDPAISLRTELAANLPFVWCDKKQILEILVPFVTAMMRALSGGGGSVLLAADKVDGQARIRLSLLGQTVRASDPADGRGAFSSVFDESGMLRLLAARRTVLQHGGTIQVAQTGSQKTLQSMTIPLYNGQRA